MLVYGDHGRRVDPGELASALRAEIRRLGEEPGGEWILRHSGLAELLVAAGEMEQGLLDWQVELLGGEVPTRLSAAATALTRAAAVALEASFRGRPVDPEELRAAVEHLLSLALPEQVEIRLPEGYALYGLYPECYLAAAGRLAPGPLQVIGVRSIGTSLGAAVAAAAGPEAGLVSVRPAGHPFDRRLELPAETARLLLGQAAGTGAGQAAGTCAARSFARCTFAIVDEGPGLSGSTFGAVADWLEDRGVPADSICFFPSHGGEPGPRASEHHRARWRRARRSLVGFEEMFVMPGAPLPLAAWGEEWTGPALGPPEDLGAGRWRARLFGSDADWPPVHLQQERRKFLVHSVKDSWLFKSAGIGRPGRDALERAAVLQAEGVIPPVCGLRHGFLVSPWLCGARPLPAVPGIDRAELLDRVGRYLALLERFPAAEEEGASLARLLEMAAYNTGEALGPEAASELRDWRPLLGDLSRQVRRVRTDNRMQAWEWLVTPGGRILKADALDHHRGHDLVGAQDLAWDLAGAAVELDLDEEEREILLERLARYGPYGYLGQRPLLLAFCEAAYLAFQLGHWTLGAQALEGSDPAESERLRAAAARYRERLAVGLASGALTPALARVPSVR